MATQFAGFVPLDGTLYIPLVTHAGTLAPAAPTADVDWSIFAGAYIAAQTPTVQTGTGGAVTGVTGGFVISQSITTANGFAAGTTYYVQASWAVSSVTYYELYTFTVT